MVNATDPILRSHISAIVPASLVMLRNCHVSSSTVNGSASTFIAARATSLSGV